MMEGAHVTMVEEMTRLGFSTVLGNVSDAGRTMTNSSIAHYAVISVIIVPFLLTNAIGSRPTNRRRWQFWLADITLTER